MGGCASHEHRRLQVATLNYSGILKNPFQFYSKDSEQDQIELGKRFTELMKKNNFTRAEGFKWDMGQIDQRMQVERYTPIYRKNAGIENGKLLSKEQFFEKWQKQFEENVGKVKKMSFTPQHKQTAKIFDAMCMESILVFIYKIDSFDECCKQDPKPYKDFSERYFGKSYIDCNVKLKKTMNAIENFKIDIIFIQEAGDQLVQELTKLEKEGKFLLKDLPDNQSMILVRRDAVKGLENSDQMLQSLSQEQRKRLNWNNDTALMFVDDLILISSHISSKKAKNQKQIETVYKDLTMLTVKYPNHKIVLGFDANTDNIDHEKITPDVDDRFYLVPDQQHEVTTGKMRTKIQVQQHKAQVKAAKRSDYIISNAKVVDSKVTSIQDREITNNNELLPSDEHPFDHFLVRAYLQL